MAKNVNHVSHIKSKQIVNGKPKLPDSSILIEGEIAINFAEGVETISTKNENGNIVTFSSDDYYTEQKLGSGFTGENSGRTVTEALKSLEITVDQVIDETTSASTNPVATKAVYNAVTNNENELASLRETVTSHTANTAIHVTSADKTKWNNVDNKQDMSGMTAYTTTAVTNTLSGTVTAHTANTDVHVTTNDKSTWNTVTAKTDTSAFTAHTADSVAHITSYERTAWNAKLDASDIVNFFDNAKYEDSGTTKVINFYHGTTIKATIDASDFIKDGMIDKVELEAKSGTTYLVITWNTDAGKTVTELNIGDIFEADNYLTKEQLTATTNYTTVTKANSANTASTVALAGVTGADDLKAIEALNGTSGILKKTAANTWTLDTTTYSSATEVNTALSTKANKATTLGGYGITDAYTKSETSGATEISNALEGKVNVSDVVSAITSDNSGSTNPVAVRVVAENERIVSESLVDLDSRKLDASAYTPTDLSDYYKKSETSGKTEISSALGGKVDNNTFTAHTASTSHMNSTEKTNLDSLATNIGAISGITSAKVNSWDGAVSSSHTHPNKATLDAITASSTAINSLTGSVGTMAFENKTSYSSATEVNTALGGKVNTSDVGTMAYEDKTSYATTSVTNTLSGTVTAHTANTDIHVTTSDKSTWNAKLDASDVEGFFGAVNYDSNTKRINFYNESTGSTVLAYVDATDFIKDGMVDNVVISGGNLVITFNTDSGKQPISIPLTDIFDPSNYYTKSETSGKTELSTAFNTKADNNSLTAHTADTSIHFTTGTVQTQIDNSISGKVNTSDIVTSITSSNSGSTNPIATSVVAKNEKVVSNALVSLDENKIGKTVNTTWSALKALRDGGNLVEGQWYRITDYVTTTTQTDTQSANHAFDVIVRADSINVLNENAYAALHSGDTYFANSNLAAWKLKYCIDNDTDRFLWAMVKSEKKIVTSNGNFPYVGEETINGITYQKWKPATPLFDIFEYVYTKNGSAEVYGSYNGNIVDLEFTYTAMIPPSEEEGYGVIYWMKDEFNNECPYDFKNILFSIGGNYCYTFNVEVSGVMTDHSLNGTYCFGNKIKKYARNNIQNLNRIVFKNTTKSSSCYSNTFGYGCYSNTFGYSCHSNTFGYGCYSNTFGYSCYSNTFNDSCYSNTFGYGCYSNTFGSYCSFNTFDKAYTKYVIIENGNRGITLTSTETTSVSKVLQNITIAQGVNNTNTQKVISHDTVNDTFKTTYQAANSQVINV